MKGFKRKQPVSVSETTVGEVLACDRHGNVHELLLNCLVCQQSFGPDSPHFVTDLLNGKQLLSDECKRMLLTVARVKQSTEPAVHEAGATSAAQMTGTINRLVDDAVSQPEEARVNANSKIDALATWCAGKQVERSRR